MISFGFTIFKLFSELKNVNELLQSGGEGSRNFGLILIGLGTFLLIAASIQHQMILKDLHVHGVTRRISLPFIAAIAISLLGLTMLFGILYNIGPLN